MIDVDFPPVNELVPHEEEMLFLQEVLEHTEAATRCAIDIDMQRRFRDSSGNIPAWVGIEYLAQVIAAHGGLLERVHGRPPRIGFLLGGRRISYYTSSFHRGQRLEGLARHSWGGVVGPVSFSCELRDRDTGELLVEGKLNCLWPKDEGEVQRILEETLNA